MTGNKTTKTAQDVTGAAYKTQQTIMHGAIAAQERNVQFAQGVFEQGVDVLKSHVGATRALLQQVGTGSQEPQNVLQVTLESTLTAQKRNAEFAQFVVESGLETLKGHVEDSRSLTQELVERAQEQQEAFQEIPYIKAYRDLFSASFASYKQATEATQAITEQMIQFGQKAAEQVMANALTALQPER